MLKRKSLAEKIIFIDDLLDRTFSKKTYLYFREIIEKLNSLQHGYDSLLEQNILLIDIINKATEYVEENLIPENIRQLNGEEFILLEILKGSDKD